MEAGTLAWVGLLGGVLALDRTALLQTMASRPLVGAALAGYLMGEPSLGLLSGVLLELLWLMDLPVGASVPPDETVSGVLAGVFAVAAPEAWTPEARASAGVLLAVPAGFAGRWLDVAVRRWNGGLFLGVAHTQEEGGPTGLGRAHWTGALRFFGAGAGATAVGAAAGSWALAAWAGGLPPTVPAALELVGSLLPVLGAAAVLAGLGLRRHGGIFAVGLAAGSVLARGGELLAGVRGRPWRR